MKAAIALLLDDSTHNFMRQLTVDIHHRFGLGYSAAQYLPHITLKQGFTITNLNAITDYFTEFAESISPFSVVLNRLELQITPDGKGNKHSILWLAVDETPLLRNLHAQLNHELATRFKNTAAMFDGDTYRFHSTLFAGGEDFESYHQAFSEFRETPIVQTSLITRIGLFFQDDTSPDSGFITYKILSLRE